MIVVSDTSAITSLIQIGRADLLPRLYSSVVIPDAVANELRRNHPELPAFIQVATVEDLSTVSRLSALLDKGEAEAIALMLEGKGDLLLMDERAGRQVALREGVPIIGLLGVLVQAKQGGLLDSLKTEIARLESIAGFRISDELKLLILRSAGEQ